MEATVTAAQEEEALRLERRVQPPLPDIDLAQLRVLLAEAQGAVARLDQSAAEHAHRALWRALDILDRLQNRQARALEVTER